MDPGTIIWHIVAVIGAIKIALVLFPWLYSKLFTRISLKQFKYGYVLITGCTEGIGRSFAKEFAKKGFKLLLVSRNSTKLQDLQDELSTQYLGNVIEILTCDFSESHKDPLCFYRNLYNDIKKYEISVLVNNVGVGSQKPLVQASFEDLENLIGVNIYPTVFLTHSLMPQFLERYKRTKQKTLIMNMSSALEEAIFVGASTYSATKRFVAFFSEGLRYEYKALEVVTVKPGPISTPLLMKTANKAPMQCDSDSFVKALMRGMRSGVNHGHWKSKFFAMGNSVWPYLINVMVVRMLISYFVKIGLMRKGRD